MIFIELPRERSTQPFLSEFRNAKNHQSSRGERPHFVTHPNERARSRRNPVDAHVPGFARVVGLCAGFVKSRRTEPAIHADGFRHPAEVYAGSRASKGQYPVCT